MECDTTNRYGTTLRFGGLRTESYALMEDVTTSGLFSFGPIDGNLLSFGQYYRVCLDIDGTGPSLSVGDSGR